MGMFLRQRGGVWPHRCKRKGVRADAASRLLFQARRDNARYDARSCREDKDERGSWSRDLLAKGSPSQRDASVPKDRWWQQSYWLAGRGVLPESLQRALTGPLGQADRYGGRTHLSHEYMLSRLPNHLPHRNAVTNSQTLP